MFVFVPPLFTLFSLILPPFESSLLDLRGGVGGVLYSGGAVTCYPTELKAKKTNTNIFFFCSTPDRNTATVASRDASEVEVREAHSQEIQISGPADSGRKLHRTIHLPEKMAVRTSPRDLAVHWRG